MTEQKYDVVVVGAGPAGSAMAIRLRQLNYSVCLVDDIKDEKRKVGESIPGAVVRLLNTLGVSGIEDLLRSDAYRSSPANMSAWSEDTWKYADGIENPEGGGWHILRNEFDAALRNRATKNKAYFVKAKIGKITSIKEGYRLKFKSKYVHSLEAKWVIDATGKSNSVSKQFGVTRKYFEEQMAAICWLKPDESNLDETTKIKSVFNGWWYSSKLPDNSRVVVFHGLTKDVSNYIKNISQYLVDLNSINIIQKEVLKQDILFGLKTTDAGVSISEKFIGDNWIAIGNAALTFDPLSSQGVFFAIYSAIKAAETIDLVEKGGDCERLREEYVSKVIAVHNKNQKSRKYFYTQELRYLHEEYWLQYFQTVNA